MLVDAKAQVDVCNEAGVTPAAAARAAGHAHLEVLEPACSSSAALSSLSAGRLFWRSSWGGDLSLSLKNGGEICAVLPLDYRF